MRQTITPSQAKRHAALLAVALLVGGGQAVAADPATLRPDELRAGMTGHGLSVFKGTEPERFGVEIVGVLPNTFPKQDMILIRLSGANLEQHKVIAGMSGSPVYIDGKLIGALAYGWGFSNEPLAGVTPIHNMLPELRRPAAPPGAAARRLPLLTERPGHPPAGSDALTPRPLLTPLALGGFSPLALRELGGFFEGLGMLPVAAGAGGGRDPRQLPQGRLTPGGSIGVQLVRGDLNATAVGTATYVDGDRTLGFGHPLFLAGQISAPAVQAEVQTIMSSVSRSFKLATAVARLGAVIGDWQSCIVADFSQEARMIPVTVEATNRDTGHSERYEMEIIDNEVFTPRMAQMAIANAIAVTSGASQDTMIAVELTAETATRKVTIANTFHNPQGGLLPQGALGALQRLFATPFGNPHVERLTARVVATQARLTAEINGAHFSQPEARHGEQTLLTVRLRPFDGPETTVTVPITIPAAPATLRQLTVIVLAGARAPADVARPDSLAGWFDMLEKQHRHTDLVTLVRLPSEGLQHRGRLLKNLPPSALVALNAVGDRDVTTTADLQQIVTATDWALSGQAVARINLKKD